MQMKYLFTFIALIALFGSSLSLSLNGKAKRGTRCDFFTYTIQSGDSLTAVARRYGDSVDGIERRNNIQRTNLIQPNQQIQVCRLQYEKCQTISAGVSRPPIIKCEWVNAK
jgi:hypothetical protein